jgi:hypothetical protein
MTSLLATIRTAGLGLAFAACAGALAQPLLRVIVEPSASSVRVDRMVELRVFLQSAESVPLPIDAGYLAIQWEQPFLLNETPSVGAEPFPMDVSYWAPGVGLNDSVTDGDAYREVLAALPGSPTDPFPAQAPAAPGRLLFTTFLHRVRWNPVPVRWSLRASLPDGARTMFTRVFRGGVIGTYRLEFDTPHGADVWVQPWTLVSDINRDGYVDLADFLILAGAYETQPGDPAWDGRADINLDGSVDLADFLILAWEYET